jgi:multidrug transporter EmrE-like cation transporter
VLMLATVEDASVMFPVLSAGNAVGACLVGRIVFKERLTVLQMISILFGILSVVLLKI